MRFFASADETGNIKEVVCGKGIDTSVKDGEKPQLVQNLLQPSDLTNVKNRITHLVTFNSEYIVTLRLGGYVTIYEDDNSNELPEENYKLLHTYKLPVDLADKPIALIKLEDSDVVIVAYELSSAFFILLNGGKFDIEPKKFDIPSRVEGQSLTLTAFVHNPYSRGVFACGGKDNDLQILKLFEKGKKFSPKDFKSTASWKLEVLFQAENVEPDHLDLEVPIWISAILFCKDAPKKGFKLVTATRHGHIRKYNTKEDTEPTDSYKVCEKPIVTLTFATEEQDEIIITDTHTHVVRLSLTKVDSKAHRIVLASAGTFYKPSLKLLGKYSEGGNTGAIHGVDVAFTKRIVAFGGLDRYLRVYNVQTRAMVAKVYLGTQISALVILDSSDGSEDEEKKREAEAEKEDEDFWNHLDEEKEEEAPAPIIRKKRRL